MTEQKFAHSLSLEAFGIQRPEKVSWRFSSSTTDVISAVKSKSLQKVLRRSEEIMQTMQLRVTDEELSLEEFELWLPYYQAKMAENQYELMASTEWYNNRIDQGKSIRMIRITQQENLVGTLVYVETHDKGTIAFRANDKLDLPGGGRSSVGSFLDYHFVQHMLDKKKTIISAGRSRNAFGVINTLGNLDYKLRFGYLPVADLTTSSVNEVPLNDEGTVVFFGFQGQQLQMYGVRPKNSPITFEAARYATFEMEFKLLEYNPT